MTHEPTSRVELVRASSVIIEESSDYLVKGILHAGDMSVWFGPSGCGKTFLALWLAHRIATGQERFFGRRVKQAPVALFSLEGANGLHKRVRALQDAHGDADELYLHRKRLALFDDLELVMEVVTKVRECGAKLIIIDTLARAMEGGDENSGQDMTKMLGTFSLIQEKTGAHVMIVHHCGKDEDRGARGHSSLRAACDVEVELSADKSSRLRSLTLTKSRDDIDGLSLWFKLNAFAFPDDSDGDPRSTCVVEEVSDTPPGKSRKDQKLTAFQAMVLQDASKLLENADHTHAEVVRRVTPRDGMPRVMAVRRDTLRESLQANGRLDGNPGDPLTAKDRGKLRDALSALEQKGVLLATSEWVWLP